MENNKITIIIPTFNRANIIRKTLESIAAQSFQNWECIVVDDHSTDSTREIIDAYSKDDARFKYMLNERKKGAQGARNTGLYNSSSEWVLFFDSDNQLQPDCLLELVAGIKTDVDVVQCFSRVINIENRKVEKYFRWCNYGIIHDHLFIGTSYVDFNHSIIRRSKLLEIGGLDEDCPSMQEWDTHMRLSKIASYNTVEKVLVDYFVGARDAISTDNKKAIKGRLYNLEKYIQDWRLHKIGLCRFVYIYCILISRVQDKQFKEDSFKKMDDLVVYRKLYALFGFFINKWYALQNYLVNNK